MIEKDTSVPDVQEPIVETQDDEAAIWAELESSDTTASPVNGDPALTDDFKDEGDEGQGDGQQPTDKTQDAPTEEPGAKAETSAAAPKAEKDNLDHRYSTELGRVRASLRRLSELQKLQGTSGEADEANPLKLLEPLKDEYPELAGPLSQALEALNKKQDHFEAAHKTRIDLELQETQEQYAAIVSEQTAILTEKYPDYVKELGENWGTFSKWIEDQPKTTRDAYAANYDHVVDGKAVIAIMDAFKAHLNPPAQQPGQTAPPANDRRSRQLASSAAPGGRTRAPTVSGIPEEGDEQAIWAAFEAMDAQKR